MRPDDHALRGMRGRKARTEREAAADALRRGHDIGQHPVMLVRIELAGPPHAALDLVKHEQQAAFVARLAQAMHERRARGTDAALALDRFDQESRRRIVDQRECRVEIVERGIGETGQQRLESVAQFDLVGCADRTDRAAVECAFECDQRRSLRIVRHIVIAPRGLDGAFDRFGARIGEEHRVGKRQVDEPLRERLTLRRSVEIADVHQRRSLILNRLHQMRVTVAQDIDCDPACEVEIALAAFADQIGTLTTHRPNPAAGIDGHERRYGHGNLAS